MKFCENDSSNTDFDFSKGVNSHLMFTSCVSEGTGNGC